MRFVEVSFQKFFQSSSILVYNNLVLMQIELRFYKIKEKLN